MLKVWIANLGKYNEGNLVGEWIDLEECGDFETAWDELKQAIGLDGEHYEEWACFDWDCDIPGLKYTEWPDIEELHDIAQEWAALDDSERAAVGARMEHLGEDFAEALDGKDDVIDHGFTTMADIAEELFESCCYDVPEPVAFYIDFDKWGRDLEMEGDFCETADGRILEFV